MAADDPRHESTAMLVSIGDCQSVVAFTRINGYLFEITDTDPQSRHWRPVIASPLPPTDKRTQA